MSVVANVAINVDALNAIQQLNRVNSAAVAVQGGFDSAKKGAAGFGSAIKDALGPLLTIAAALATVKQGLDTAFTRGAAEQRLRNLTSSANEFKAALALAADSSQKFGISQTDTVKALADVYGRLKGVGFGLKETGQIYQGFNAIALQSGVAGEEAAGAFFQLSQALGKGKLNGDEFVIIAERMPALLDAIAQTTGRGRDQLTGMAQAGEITSQVLYQALASAANAAGGLTDKLTQQQQASIDLRLATDQLYFSIGKVFEPAVIAGIQGLSYVFTEINAKMPEITAGVNTLLGPLIAIGQYVLPAVKSAFEGLLGNIKGVLQTVTFFTTFAGILKAITLATQAWAFATQSLAAAKKGAAVAAAALQAIMNPANIAKIAVAIGGAAAASYALGKAMDNATQNSKQTGQESKNLVANVDKLLQQYSSLPPVILNSKDAAKQLKDEQKQITAEIERQLQLLQAQIARENQIITKSAELIQARTQAEVASNNATKQRLEAELKGNIPQERRVQIAKNIYNLEVANAKAQRIASLAQIDANIQLAAQAVKEQTLKLKSLEVEKQLLISKKMETAAIDHAIKLQKEGIKMAEDNYKFSVAIGKEQAKVAEEVYKSAVDAAEQNYKSNSAAQKLASNTAAAANEAGRYAQNTKKALSYTEKLMQQIGSVKYRDRKGPGVTGRIAAPSDPYLQRVLKASPGDPDVIRQVVLAQQQRAYADALKQYEEDLMTYKSYRAAGISAPVPARPKPPSGNFGQSYSLYAEGGFVTRPTNAIIGEGGEAEYVIPASKMSEAMARYSAGARGSSVIPNGVNPQVNITTGPVTQMNGTNYVTQRDLMYATQTAAKEGATIALNSLRSNPSVRRSVGLAR